MIDTNKQILQAAHQFKKAMEQMGNKDIVLIYSYVGKNAKGRSTVFGRHVSSNFIHVLGTCELIKHEILCAGCASNP